MKNFLDLLATDFGIDIVIEIVPGRGKIEAWINDKQVYCNTMVNPTVINYKIPLLQPVAIKVIHTGAYVKSLTFDGWQARPKHGQELPGIWQFEISQPFYQWLHHATAQGWLLEPQM